MAITNNLGQTKVGVRVPLSVVIPTQSALLDSYSGAAAAYSLRKLTSTYTGSAIRVRRSSDNTEMDIGFDAGGNLDTVALSQFVGSGSGFVTTWYDQSGNGNNATQTTSSYQPQIVSNGSILTTNGKPSIKLDGVDDEFVLNSSISSDVSTYQSFVGKRESSGDRLYALSNNAGTGYIFGLLNDNNYYLQAKSGFYQSSNSTDTTTSQLLLTGKVSSGIMSIFKNGNTIPSTQSTATISPFINSIGKYLNSLYPTKCSLQEIVFYNNDQTSNQTGIESNINTYYSVYPNPTSVWNLLNAVYSADTTASSSLKTSLFAAYNGESNANDSFGTNNGTAQGGLTYTTGKIGNAFQFNGSNAYVSLPNNSFNNLTGDFSVSFWMNLNNSHSTDFGMLFSNLQFPVGYSTYYGFQIGFYNGQIYFTVGSDTGYSTASTRLVSNTLSGYIGTWVYVTCTHKQSTGYKIYVNGVLNNSNNGTYNPVYTTNHTPTIGAQYSVNSSPNNLTYKINGSVDALNIWNKELTASEVSELYNSGNGAQYITDNFYKPTTNDALGINNGTAQGGLTYGTGKVGTAFQFNGTNAYVSLPDNSLNFTNKFSYSFWIKSNDTTNYGVVVGNVQSPRSPYSTFHGYEIGMESGKFFLFFRNGYGNQYIYYTTDVVNNGNWNHIVVTYDPTNPTTGAKIYVNGTLDRQVATLNPINYSSPMKACIGARNHSGSPVNFLPSGTNLDELNVWAKELTSSEVTELYNSGNGKQYPN